MTVVGSNAFSGPILYTPTAFVGGNGISGPTRYTPPAVVGGNAESGPTPLGAPPAARGESYSGLVYWPQLASRADAAFSSSLNMDLRGQSAHNYPAFTGPQSFAVVTSNSTQRSTTGPYTAMGGRGWVKRAKFKIAASFLSGTVLMQGFPILLTQAALPAGFIAACRSDGGDIRISRDKDGANLLPREIVNFDQGNTLAEIWFAMDVTGGADAFFYVWYGNPTATEPAVQDPSSAKWVWLASGITHAYHLDTDLTVSPTAPSSAVAIQGSLSDGSAQASPSRITSPIGRGALFNGTSQRIDLTQSTDFQLGETILSGFRTATSGAREVTIEAWVKVAALPAGDRAIASFGFLTATKKGIALFVTSTGTVKMAFGNGTTVTSLATTTTLGTSAWHHILATVDGSSGAIYIDGATTGTTTAIPVVSFTAATYFGIAADNDAAQHYLNANIDEVRIARIKRTAAWAATAYSNGNNQLTFNAWQVTDTLSSTETGTGALTAGSATMLGTGSRQITGSGTPAGQRGTLAASGTVVNNGSGALQAPSATLAATGKHGIPGTGAVTGQSGTLSGAGDVVHAGTGALQAQSCTISGTATLQHLGSGALTGQRATLDAAGDVVHSGSGALVSGSGAISGAGAHTATTGDAESVAASATQTPTTGHNGSGDLQGQSSTMTGAAGLQHSGSGALVATSGSMSGSGTVANTAVGTLTGQSGTLLGSGHLGHIGVGAMSGQSGALSGSGDRGVNGSGALAADPAHIVDTAGNNGRGDMLAQSSTLSGSGFLAFNNTLSANVTATYSPAGTPKHNGTGALQAQSSSMAGVGSHGVHGTGALAGTSGTCRGLGPNHRTGTGDLQQAPSTMYGRGDAYQETSGALQAQPATMSGHGNVNITGTGTGELVGRAAGMFGLGKIGPTGFGVLTARAATMSAHGYVVPSFFGAMQALPANMFAYGNKGHNGRGSQVLRAGNATLHGTGTHKHITNLGSAAIHAQSAHIFAGDYIHNHYISARGDLAADFAIVVVDRRMLPTGPKAIPGIFLNLTDTYLRSYVRLRMFDAVLSEVVIAPHATLVLQEPGYATQHLWNLVESGVLQATRGSMELTRVPDPDPLALDVG